MKPEPLTSVDAPGWLELRAELWPDCPLQEHREEMAAFISQPQRFAQFVVRSEDNRPLGFAEASVRTDYVPGTETSPVAFLEGLYVRPEARRRGIARMLMQAVATWARGSNCTELASDTQLGNTLSQAVHQKLGFAETERVVFFRKALHGEDAAWYLSNYGDEK
jgi:aminoglycoside 6'-N-acetyltransferase I